MDDQKPNPFLEAKPPVTDYLTYLTIIEYNLSKVALPTLQDVLQTDSDLTINIGWDLVHLLIPLLPESVDCLQVIARSGNPREVVLKVTEALRLLGFGSGEEDDYYDGQEAEAIAGPSAQEADQIRESIKLALMQFQALVAMLAILHPRIKTEYPSRFLSTSLQAILVAFQRAGEHADQITDAILAFVKALSGSRRPQLPPRTSSGNIMRSSTLISAPDPEGTAEAASVDEIALQNRLLQSFITHVLEDYVLSLSSKEDVPGLSWCSRYMEKIHPDRIPDTPGRVPFAEQFAEVESLTARSSTIGQIVAIADELKLLDSPELLQTCLNQQAEATGEPNEEEEPPSSAEDVPLSKTGALFLGAAGLARKTLFGVGGVPKPLPIFPDHAILLENYIGITSTTNVGSEPEALVDTILFLGLVSLEHDLIGEPINDKHFLKYLQTTSLLSANCPSPSLRYHAHYLTTTVLRSHPSELVRLGLIRDTLEYCPYENLKASAIGWLKGETMEAALDAISHSQKTELEERSIFATPVAIESVAPFLFADVSGDADAFRANLTLYITTLNFYYLLLKARPLHAPLAIRRLHRDTGKKWLKFLDVTIQTLDDDVAEELKAELGIIAEVRENIQREAEQLTS